MNSTFPPGFLYNDTDDGRGGRNLSFPGRWRGRARFDDLGPTTRVSLWLLVGAALTFLVLRVYCKLARHRRVHADDYFLIAAWLALLGGAISNNMAIDLGYGKHVWQIPFRNLNDMYLIGQITNTLAICAAAWSKTSFGITLLIVADGVHGKTCIFILFALVSMNLLLGITAMLYWVGCTPLEKAWHPFVRGICWSPNVLITYNIFTSAYSGAMDLILAVIPWKIIMSLPMQTKEKIGVALAMSMGVFAAASAFIKCSALPELSGRDFPHDGVTLIIWGSAEAAVTIMAASVPMLRMLFRGARRSRKEKHSSTSRSISRTYNTTGSSRKVYYNKPRRDLVTMTGSTWTGGSR